MSIYSAPNPEPGGPKTNMAKYDATIDKIGELLGEAGGLERPDTSDFKPNGDPADEGE